MKSIISSNYSGSLGSGLNRSGGSGESGESRFLGKGLVKIFFPDAESNLVQAVQIFRNRCDDSWHLNDFDRFKTANITFINRRDVGPPRIPISRWSPRSIRILKDDWPSKTPSTTNAV
ncbi:hypothetical protein NLI96_g59 [Meripilus lineatus]|uniref:Uncharacterized protein n=1 Tax=Meripilus lineatus TaxID=2056292 RepID=A0AAD5YJR0_9APHY|nr:hypothetical protein NLI96_g59 [Physisporinus lineatus]